MSDEDNLELWNSVCTTDYEHIDEVSWGAYKFTSIKAYSQIRAATAVFGRIGEGWTFSTEIIETNAPEACATLKGNLRYRLDAPEGWSNPIEQYETVKWMMGQKLDHEALKKASTSCLTKCLSMLGFNADVFLDEYSNPLYLKARRAEAAERRKATQPPEPKKPEGPPLVGDGEVEVIRKAMNDRLAECEVAEEDRGVALKAIYYDATAAMGVSKVRDVELAKLDEFLGVIMKWKAPIDTEGAE